MAVLDRHREGSVERNLFLQTILGMLSLSTALESVILGSGPARADVRQRTRPDDGAFVDATLGLLVLTRRVHELARSVAVAPAPTAIEPLRPRRGLLA